MKTTEQFWNEITTNKELAEKLHEVKNDRELEAFLKENEVSGTAEEFKKLVATKAKESGELSDEQLGEAAGGAFDYATDKATKYDNKDRAIQWRDRVDGKCRSEK